MKATHKDWIVFNGRIVNTKEEQPMIPLEERGFQFGDGIYEVFRLYDGKPHLLDLHLERFFHSMEEIKLIPPFTKEELVEELYQMIEKINFKKMGMYICKYQEGFKHVIMYMSQICNQHILQTLFLFTTNCCYGTRNKSYCRRGYTLEVLSYKILKPAT